MNIVTYNLRFVYTKDGINSFIHRAGLILDTIRKEQPDIICFQEATDAIADFLRSCLSPAYTILLTQREEGLTGEGLAVAYRPEAVTLYGLEVFWLSPTPQVVASKFPGQSKHSRICQNLLFKDERSGRPFRLYNLHLEEVSEDARVKQMELVLERQSKETVPTILLGDFNSRSDGQVAPLCKSKGLADVTAHITHSFHGFGKWEQGIKLDYIFADPETAQTISNVHIWDACLNGIYLSDHYPIAMELQF
jgi:endonuclease/exonuclease/phosphatase family metal-dependent hydrolase